MNSPGGETMTNRTCWETVKAKGSDLLEKVKQLLQEGNVRRIVIKQGDRTIAEFPLTVGVIGTLFAPVIATIGALVALLTDCSIAVEREVSQPTGAEISV